MLKVIIPNNNIPEREYIINTLLSDYLGLHYTIIANESCQHYSIYFDNNELVIKDCFFNNYPNALSYLTANALPDKIVCVKNDFTVEKDIPVIYGSDELTVTNNKIVCGMDFFASSFFMLTRWEEYINKSRDEHMRFPDSETVAYKYNFLNRPVVNEYIEMLWGLLFKLGYKGERKKRSYELILTHDIDHLDYPRTFKIILGDILKRKNIKLAWKHLMAYLKTGKNPYDTFNFIMTLSEKLGLKSHFYFMSSDSNKQPDTRFYLNSKRFRDKVKEVKSRGHMIGFHPGYYTYNNPERWSYEKKLLENATRESITEGRQHYLRFESPMTFRLWEKNNMAIDSTMGYALKEGFRCGTGDIYPVFDFLERRQMLLRERPLIIMDGTLQPYSHEQSLEIFKHYIALGKRYNSAITLLFHNSTFYGEDWGGYDSLYLKALGLK
jgi:hypothetical protein